jgi:hypothetical protein
LFSFPQSLEVHDNDQGQAVGSTTSDPSTANIQQNRMS